MPKHQQTQRGMPNSNSNIISDAEQNKLARLYPFYFDKVPDRIPLPLLFGSDNYTISEQLKLEDLLFLKGQRVRSTHDRGTTFDRLTVLSSSFVQGRWKKLQARKNFARRKAAGAVRSGTLGIVGNNLDNCNTSEKKQTRAGIYKAQNMIQKIRLDGEPIVCETVCGCGKPLESIVKIRNNTDHNSSSVSAVQTCGSVWACPVCRSRIVSRRAEELKEIYQKWTAKNGKIYMLTLTVPHSKTDNLAELYGSNAQKTGISGALSYFRESRDFSKVFKDQVGYYGDLRGIEVTWGWHNGFHPHIHMLILTKEYVDFKEWKIRFHSQWVRACQKAGLGTPSWEHGVDLSYCDNEEKAQYIAKWSAASELVSGSMKQGRSASNFTIAELERCLWDRSYRKRRKIRRKRAASVLRAYYGAMKGQRMLQPGGIGPDGSWKKELLEHPEEEELEPEKFTDICWLDSQAYIKIKRTGKLPALLEASERGETLGNRRDQVRAWLRENGFDPEDCLGDPRPPDPPPRCFSYFTGYQEEYYFPVN